MAENVGEMFINVQMQWPLEFRFNDRGVLKSFAELKREAISQIASRLGVPFSIIAEAAEGVFEPQPALFTPSGIDFEACDDDEPLYEVPVRDNAQFMFLGIDPAAPGRDVSVDAILEAWRADEPECDAPAIVEPVKG